MDNKTLPFTKVSMPIWTTRLCPSPRSVCLHGQQDCVLHQGQYAYMGNKTVPFARVSMPILTTRLSNLQRSVCPHGQQDFALRKGEYANLDYKTVPITKVSFFLMEIKTESFANVSMPTWTKRLWQLPRSVCPYGQKDCANYQGQYANMDNKTMALRQGQKHWYLLGI
ncbi:hypothetical protein DPMN_070843 [Dreissena polymorpha]|uniref:Uncharacterized protein n=1 Tax=Dreissena polymorpha TaxID=45954 RepID=A0A9D3Z1H5_DREPO|nr:hypothetical protein DPMN_070843 [Dreissena polymorpha]